MLSHTNESCQIDDEVMSHTWMLRSCHTHGCFGHVTHMDALVMSHTWMLRSCRTHGCFGHVAHMDASCPTRVPRINKSCHTCEWVTCTYARAMVHVWQSHVAHMDESYHTYDGRVPHIWMRLCVMHIWMSHITHVTDLHHASATHMNASRHTYDQVMSHVWISHVTHMQASCRAYEYVMSHIWRRGVTHMNVSHDTYGLASASRIDKIIGLFAKEPYKRDNILQKRPVILSILLTVATPYDRVTPHIWMRHVTRMLE